MAAAADVVAAEEEETEMNQVAKLGLGIGWRREIALTIERRTDLGFVEIVADDFFGGRALPAALMNLRERGLKIVPHGLSLSLGGAERVDARRVAELASVADRVGAPLVSEHIAFVRADGVEAGHLLPIPRTWAALDVLVENVLEAKKHLPVPLALENISTLVEWPGAEMDEATFFRAALERTDSLMLLDIANLWANAKNFGRDALAELRELPLERLAYVHIGGGVERDGVYHDTHAARAPAGVIELLGELCAIATPPGAMLERDDHYPPPDQLNAELDAIAGAMTRGAHAYGAR